jgi:hypothetical protein
MIEIVSDSYLGLNSSLDFLRVEGKKYSLMWKKRLILGVKGKFFIEELIGYSLPFKE